MPGHPIVHVEFPTRDLKEAGTFYADVFGWQIDSETEPSYPIFQAEGGPGGAFVALTEATSNSPVAYAPNRLLVFIGADDIDAALAKIEAHGGKTIMPRTEIPPFGAWAVFADPTGNQVGLYTGGQQAVS